MKIRITRWHVLPSSESSLFDERATVVAIDDEAGGEFVKVSQLTDSSEPGSLEFNPEEWPTIREAIDNAVLACREFEAEQ